MGDPLSFLIAVAVGLVLTPLARRLALRLDLVDRPATAASPSDVGLKIHRAPVPLLGGLAALAAFFVGGAVAPDRPLPWVAGAVAVAVIVGTVDDVRPLPPGVRVVAVAAAGLVLALGDLTLAPLGWFAAIATVALVVAMANAVNIVDGQDALAGGVAAVAAVGIAGAAALLDLDGVAPFGLALAGGLLAFLVWNRPPASIFLGNGGAYGVGAALAALGTLTAMMAGWRGLLAVAACLGVFAFEVATTVVRRSRARAPVALGDRGHAYDVLSRRLGSRERSTVVMILAGIGCALVGATTAMLPAGVAWIPVAGLAVAAVPAAIWLHEPEGDG